LAGGKMGLDLNYYYSLTLRQFLNIYQGWAEKREVESLERQLLFRKIMFTNLLPWSKNITETSLWHIPGVDPEPTEVDEEYLEEIEASKKRWEETDKKQKKVIGVLSPNKIFKK
jgi:hypothetical protein